MAYQAAKGKSSSSTCPMTRLSTGRVRTRQGQWVRAGTELRRPGSLRERRERRSGGGDHPLLQFIPAGLGRAAAGRAHIHPAAEPVSYSKSRIRLRQRTSELNLCVRRAGGARESWAPKGRHTLTLEQSARPTGSQRLVSSLFCAFPSLVPGTAVSASSHGRLDAPWVRPRPSHAAVVGPALGPIGPALGPAVPSGYPPASLRASVQEGAVRVGAQATGGALLQHVVAALLPADRLLVQPRAERDARHLGVRALQVGSWQWWKRQEGGVSEHAQPWEPGRPLGEPGSATTSWVGLGHSLDLPEVNLRADEEDLREHRVRADSSLERSTCLDTRKAPCPPTWHTAGVWLAYKLPPLTRELWGLTQVALTFNFFIVNAWGINKHD